MSSSKVRIRHPYTSYLTISLKIALGSNTIDLKYNERHGIISSSNSDEQGFASKAIMISLSYCRRSCPASPQGLWLCSVPPPDRDYRRVKMMVFHANTCSSPLDDDGSCTIIWNCLQPIWCLDVYLRATTTLSFVGATLSFPVALPYATQGNLGISFTLETQRNLYISIPVTSHFPPIADQFIHSVSPNVNRNGNGNPQTLRMELYLGCVMSVLNVKSQWNKYGSAVLFKCDRGHSIWGPISLEGKTSAKPLSVSMAHQAAELFLWSQLNHIKLLSFSLLPGQIIWNFKLRYLNGMHSFYIILIKVWLKSLWGGSFFGHILISPFECCWPFCKSVKVKVPKE